MPQGWGYHSIRATNASESHSRITATGLIVAKYIEMYGGNQEPLFESINKLMEGDADQIGGTLLTLLNLFVMFVSDNGNNERQLKEMCDFLVKSISDETPVQRILR